MKKPFPLLAFVVIGTIFVALALFSASFLGAPTHVGHPKPVVVTIQGSGSQVPVLYIPSLHQYAGGAFLARVSGGNSAITRIIVTQQGSVASSNLANVHVHYDVTSSDCSSQTFSESDPQFGFPTTFDSASKAVFTGNVSITPTQSACFYVALDVRSTAVNGQTLELAIADPATEVIAYGDVDVCPLVHNPPPDGPLVDTCPQRGIPGATTLSLPPPSVVTVAGIGSQAPFLNIPSTAQYVGGTFRMLPDTSATTISRVIVTETGTVAASTNLFGVHLHYDLDATAPYDCTSETFSETDPTYGITTTFNSINKATFDDTATISPTQAVCFYAVLDVKSGAVHNQTLELEIMNPSQEVVTSAGASVSPSNPVPVSGTTLLTASTPIAVTVNALGTQVSTIYVPSSANYIGAAWRMLTDSGSTTITKIGISEQGTVSEAYLTGLKLYYDLDMTAPYDCISESFAGTDALYSVATSSSGNKVFFTGSVTVSTTQAPCFYFVFDVGSSAGDGQTVEMEITNPALDVTVASGATVSSTAAVPLSGTTILSKVPSLAITVAAKGSQAPLLKIPSAGQYLGGAFAITSNVGPTAITKITLRETGTVAGVNLTGVKLYYDLDTASPYDCAGESYATSDGVYGVGTPGSGETALFTGSTTVSTTQAVCLYVVLDVASGAHDGETLDIEIANPSADVVASGGAAVLPSTTVALAGTTVLSASGTQTGVNDGDLIRLSGDHKVYIVKFAGSKKFIRHIIDSQIFSFYPHLGFSSVKDVPTLEGYTLSAWVRLPMTSDPFTWRVYEVNDDPGAGGSKHWITCANPDQCGPTWLAHGGDPDGIYSINSQEMNYYVTGPNVFLQ